MTRESWKHSAIDITLIGLMVAVIEVCKVTMMGLPNIELTTFWMILFTLYFGYKIFIVIPVFILIEGVMFGFGLWWIMYLYIWPLLAVITLCFKRQKSVWFWSIFSGLFGLFFGLLCAIPYAIIGATSGGVQGALSAGFTFWIAGIPFDLLHCGGNTVLMLVLYKPVRRVMEKAPILQNHLQIPPEKR